MADRQGTFKSISKRSDAKDAARVSLKQTQAKQSENHSPISRGYLKMEGAAKAFHFDFRGKTVLDIGSSTGGFTQYALDHGAKKVIAVEKGTNQMQIPLRYDPRVELHEKTDIFDFKLDSKIDVVVADISFLSLKPVLKHIRNLKNADYLMMLKPQFEARPSQLNRGVIKNSKIRREIIKDFEQWLSQNHYVIIDKHDNHLHGKTGNQERFYWLKQAKIRQDSPRN